MRASIDPGKHVSAVAIWLTDESGLPSSLHSVALYQQPESLGIAVDLEFPDRLSPGTRLEDLLDLTAAAGGWEAANRVCRRVKPSAWNGAQKKPITHRKVWRALNGLERGQVARSIGMSELAIENKIVEACDRLGRTGKVTRYSWQAHNLLDAVGIGLWVAGRLR